MNTSNSLSFSLLSFSPFSLVPYSLPSFVSLEDNSLIHFLISSYKHFSKSYPGTYDSGEEENHAPYLLTMIPLCLPVLAFAPTCRLAWCGVEANQIALSVRGQKGSWEPRALSSQAKTCMLGKA